MILILCVAYANVTTIESESGGSAEKSDNINSNNIENQKKISKIGEKVMNEKQETADSGTSTGDKSKKKGILGVAEDYVKDTTTGDDFRERWRPKRPATAREIKEIEERAKVRLYFCVKS